MKRTRIVLVGMPRLMIDIVDRLLADIPDAQVAARLPPEQDVPYAVRHHRADLVIVGAAQSASSPAGLFRCRPVAVLEVGDSGQFGTVWVMRPHARSIGELSAERLAEAIRLVGSA